MSRLPVCAVLIVALLAGASRAEDEKSAKKGETVEGEITKVDPSAYEIHVTFPKGKKSETRMFRIVKATNFVFYTTAGKKEVKGRDAFKEKGLKGGAKAKVLTDKLGAVTEVRVGTPPKKEDK
jgi:hypothetical protein